MRTDVSRASILEKLTVFAWWINETLEHILLETLSSIRILSKASDLLH